MPVAELPAGPVPWKRVVDFVVRNGGFYGELDWGGWAFPLIFDVTWHTGPAMSFADTGEIREMEDCVFKGSDDATTFSYIALQLNKNA